VSHILRTHYPYLIENIDVQRLLPQLVDDDVINSEEMNNITSEKSREGQTQRLLYCIETKSAQDYDHFLDALDKTGQTGVSRYLRNNSIPGKQPFVGRCTFEFNILVNSFLTFLSLITILIIYKYMSDMAQIFKIGAISDDN